LANDELAGAPVFVALEDPLLNEGEEELNAEVVPLFKFFPLSLVLLNVISLRLASNMLFSKPYVLQKIYLFITQNLNSE